MAKMPTRTNTGAGRPRGSSRLPNSAISTRAKPIDQHIASRMRLRRLQIGWTMELAAEKLGTFRQKLRQWENCRLCISAADLFHVANVYEVQPLWFYLEPPSDRPELQIFNPPKDPPELRRALEIQEFKDLVLMISELPQQDLAHVQRFVTLAFREVITLGKA